MTNHLLIASDYPHWDGDNPDLVLPAAMSSEAKHKIRYDNARLLYGP